MNNIQHVHEVIFMVQQNDGQYTAESLVEAITEKWGADVQFMACSGVPFPKEDALDFIIGKNKVELIDGKIRIVTAMSICNGHENFQA